MSMRHPALTCITRLGPDLFKIRVRTTDPRSGIRKESQRTENVSFKEACALQDRLEADVARELACPEDKAERLTIREFAESWLTGKIDRDK